MSHQDTAMNAGVFPFKPSPNTPFIVTNLQGGLSTSPQLTLSRKKSQTGLQLCSSGDAKSHQVDN